MVGGGSLKRMNLMCTYLTLTKHDKYTHTHTKKNVTFREAERDINEDVIIERQACISMFLLKDKYTCIQRKFNSQRTKDKNQWLVVASQNVTFWEAKKI